MSLHVTTRAEVVELGGIVGDAALALAGIVAVRVLSPVLAFARWVDDRLGGLE